MSIVSPRIAFRLFSKYMRDWFIASFHGANIAMVLRSMSRTVFLASIADLLR